MSARVPFQGFVGSAFRAQSLRFDSQDLWNWYLERAESPSAKSGQALLPCPGFETWVTLPTTPVRGLFAQNNRLFAVGGEVLYEISRLGAITARATTAVARPSTPIITQNPLPDPLPAPTAPVVSHGGAIGSTTYGYKITATNIWGETVGSAEGTSPYGNAILSSTNWNIVSWTYVQGATGYKVYRTSGPDAGVVVAVVSSTTLVINDIGTAGTIGTPPLVNLTGGYYQDAHYGYKIVATLGTGQSAASPEGVTNTSWPFLSLQHYNIITWSRVPNATGYKVYRTSGSLLTTSPTNPSFTIEHPPERLLTTITDTDPTSAELLTFQDIGQWGTEEVPPVTNSTGLATLVDDGTPVSWASSGDAGNQMLVVSGGFAYCYDLVTDVFAQVVEGATFGGFIDSYFVVLDAGSSTLKVSESFDGFRWDPTQVYQRSRAGDKWLSMTVTSNEIWLIGSQTGEVWVGTGQNEGRFAPYAPVFLEVGIIAPASLLRIAGAVMWLAQDKDGAGFIVRTNGYTPQPASPIAVTFSIQSLTTIADAFAFTYQQEGHTFYVLTFPTDNQTWAYDVTTSEWHKRGWWEPNAMRFHAYRPQCHAFAFGGVGFGKNLVGDRLSGLIAEMDPVFGYDIDGSKIRRVRQSPHIALKDQEATIDRLQMDMDVGLGLAAGQGSDPTMMLTYSKDWGRSWSHELWRSAGKQGQTEIQVAWNRLGTVKGRVFRLVVTDPVPWRIVGAWLELEGS